MNPLPLDRRQFLRLAATGAAGLSLGVFGTGCDDNELTSLIPEPTPFPPGPGHPIPYITSAESFFVLFIRSIPSLDPATWSMTVDGLVDNPLTITLDDLRSMAQGTRLQTIPCIGNRPAGDSVGNAEWSGVPLRDVLERAGLRPEGTEVAIYCADGYSTGFPLADLTGVDTMLALDMNGAPLTPGHGFPVRLLVPGRFGMKNPKWIKRFEIRDTHYQGYYERFGWSDTAYINVNSRIDLPRNGDEVGLTGMTIYGTAWASSPGIQRVEITTDGGVTWNEASLDTPQPINPLTWVLWSYHWAPPGPGRYVLKARAYDGSGEAQPDTDPNVYDGQNPVVPVTVNVTDAPAPARHSNPYRFKALPPLGPHR